MEDKKIVDLYWSRDQSAIEETRQKYGRLCRHIANNILRNFLDVEECENDTYLLAWNSMPDNRPDYLAAYLGKITRNLALNIWKQQTAKKRGGGKMDLVLDELAECVSGKSGVEEENLLKELLEEFVKGLKEEERRIFILRYWKLDSIAEIAEKYNMNENKITSMLFRLRKRLRIFLEKEGYPL